MAKIKAAYRLATPEGRHVHQWLQAKVAASAGEWVESYWKRQLQLFEQNAYDHIRDVVDYTFKDRFGHEVFRYNYVRTPTAEQRLEKALVKAAQPAMNRLLDLMIAEAELKTGRFVPNRRKAYEQLTQAEKTAFHDALDRAGKENRIEKSWRTRGSYQVLTPELKAQRAEEKRHAAEMQAKQSRYSNLAVELQKLLNDLGVEGVVASKYYEPQITIRLDEEDQITELISTLRS